ncbi:hypothetical protein [Chelonobacter oris]|uniref:hypothetical protein n=1 Tax=Chelonobacter oris TaxID=505317 RepID=UPI00244A01E5|nr:hypothetical protein [Chelonobacter oris]
MHRVKEKIWAEKIAGRVDFIGLLQFLGWVYAKYENEQEWWEMGKNWIIFCIKVIRV